MFTANKTFRVVLISRINQNATNHLGCKNFLLGQMARFRRVSLLFPIFWVALPPTAFAYTRGGRAIGFTSGLRRPFSRWDYIFGTVAAGIWGGQLGAPAIWLLPVICVITMLFGGMLGFVGVRLPRVQPGIALSVIVFAVAILSEAEPELWIAAAIV